MRALSGLYLSDSASRSTTGRHSISWVRGPYSTRAPSDHFAHFCPLACLAHLSLLASLAKAYSTLVSRHIAAILALSALATASLERYATHTPRCAAPAHS